MNNHVQYIRPIWRRIPRDPDAIRAYHRALNAPYASQRRWKLFGAWIGFVAFCALCWYGILWLAYKATEGVR